MINGNAIVNGPLLSVRGLEVGFGQSGNVLPGKVLHNVGFEVARGEILGLVGESGSGKSVTCRALMGMLRRNAVIQWQMRRNGVDYDLAQQRRLAPLRGSVISMIFQDPMSALDPLMS